MRIFLIFLFLFVCCKQENFSQNKNVDTDQAISDSIDLKVDDTLSYIDDMQLYADDPLFKELFVFKFYDNYMKFYKNKDLTLVHNQIDTSISFNFILKNHRHSRKVDKYLNDHKSLFSKLNNISSSVFFLEDIKSLDENIFLGIFVEYIGFERMLYGYSKLNIKEKNLNIENLYYSLDMIGIGNITYDQVLKLDDGAYCIVGNNIGEGHQSISLHYFPKDYRNKTYMIEKCNPSSEANPHDEKLEYNIDYKNKIITIDKFEMERDKEKDWRKLSTNSYNILDLIEQIKK